MPSTAAGRRGRSGEPLSTTSPTAGWTGSPASSAPRESFGRGTTPQVQVEVRNASGREQRFVYRWIWLDGGFRVDTNKTRDQAVTIKPREVKALRGTAPSVEVTGWRLQLGRAD